MSTPERHFTSPYAIGGLNESIHLGEETLAFVSDELWSQCRGSVKLEFLPRPRMLINGEFPMTRLAPLRCQYEHLGLPDRGVDAPGFSTSISSTIGIDRSFHSIEWLIDVHELEVLGDNLTVLERVVFHIVNLVDFESRDCSWENSGTFSCKIKHLKLQWGGYDIHIRSIPSTSKTTKSFREQGGYEITHLGEIRHADGSPMVVANVKTVLKGLDHFLSLASGKLTPTVLPVGFDSNGDVVWEYWNAPPIDSYVHTQSWFDAPHGNHLEACFPGFMDLWTDSIWQDAIHEAVYWYLNSNYSPRGIDAGIILTQTALERLSYTYFVEHGLLTWKKFDNLKASDRIRDLLSKLRIPLAIPSTLVETTILAGTHQWPDGPQAMTDIRNDKVHPQRKNRGKFDPALAEVWTLGLWYVEMVLLNLSSYNGDYANRLASPREVGQVEKVAWAP